MMSEVSDSGEDIGTMLTVEDPLKPTCIKAPILHGVSVLPSIRQKPKDNAHRLVAFQGCFYWRLLRDLPILHEYYCEIYLPVCKRRYSAQLLLTTFGVLFEVDFTREDQIYTPDFFVVPYACIEEFKHPQRKGLVNQLIGGTDKMRVSLSTRDLRVFEIETPAAQSDLPGQIRAMRHQTFEAKEPQFAPFVFDLQAEWKRQGIGPSSGLVAVDNYSSDPLCPSYPHVLLYPAALCRSDLKAVAEFRVRHRLPALTFHWAKREAYLWRGAQPRPGIVANRCREDEFLLSLLHSPKCPSDSRPDVHLYDARDFLAVLGNTLGGKGGEIPSNYPNCVIQLSNLPNAHAVQASFRRLGSAALLLGEEDFAMAVGASAWLSGLARVLTLAAKAAASLDGGFSVFLHCSDGWDRTAQVSALAQLILDPHFRTIEGFLALIYKDFCLFGHQFCLRQRDLQDKGQAAPIFLQFLDCVHQLIRTNPQRFGFGQQLLVDLAIASYAGGFAEFRTYSSQPPALPYLFPTLMAERNKYVTTFNDEPEPLRVPQKVFALEPWRDFLLFFFRKNEFGEAVFLTELYP